MVGVDAWNGGVVGSGPCVSGVMANGSNATGTDRIVKLFMTASDFFNLYTTINIARYVLQSQYLQPPRTRPIHTETGEGPGPVCMMRGGTWCGGNCGQQIKGQCVPKLAAAPLTAPSSPILHSLSLLQLLRPTSLLLRTTPKGQTEPQTTMRALRDHDDGSRARHPLDFHLLSQAHRDRSFISSYQKGMRCCEPCSLDPHRRHHTLNPRSIG